MLNILFYSINGLGIGHIIRGINIAKHLKNAIPCEIIFATNSPYIELFKEEGFNFVQGGTDPAKVYTKKISQEEYGRLNEEFLLSVIKDFGPDMVIFDLHILPGIIEYLKSSGIFSVYILNEVADNKYFICQKEAIQKIDLILLTGNKDFFTPRQLLSYNFSHKNVFFVGNIFREPSLAGIKEVLSKYNKRAGEFMITVSPGGGGYLNAVNKFFMQIDSISQQIGRETNELLGCKKIRWCFFKGPLFKCKLNITNKKIELYDYEKNMPSLFSISDLIITGGGYNSINEIIALKKPALVYPFYQRMDSHIGRIDSYSKKGFLKVLDTLDTKKALKVVRSALNPKTLKQMKEAFAGVLNKNGGRFASARILDGFLKFSSKTKKVAVLRLYTNTDQEHFIYEETESFKKYRPFYLTGKIEGSNKMIKDVFKGEYLNVSYKNSTLPIFNKNSIKRFGDIINLIDIDVIFCEFLTDAISFLPLLQKNKRPIIVNFRGYELSHPKILDFLPKIASLASKIITRSSFQRSILIKHDVAPEKIEVIYGGIDPDKITFDPRLIQKNDLKFLSAGRLVEKKGFDVLLGAFKKIAAKYEGAKLTILGDGELKENIETMINNMRLEKSVKLLPALAHNLFIQELSKHDIFILLSKTTAAGDSEGIPNVLKEAMASGMPVISTFHAGIPELIEDGRTGFLVKENDESSVLEKIKTIVNNNQQMKKNCLNARFVIEKYFDVRKSSVTIESLFDKFAVNEIKKEFRVDLHLSSGCNSHCLMCDNWKIKRSSPMSTKSVISLLDELKRFKVTYVRFHGQEPTLRKDLLCILKETKARSFRVGLKTNALFFDSIKKITSIIGVVDDLYLSIDSADPEIHNLLRGEKQSFRRNIKLIKSLKQRDKNIKIYINSVLTNINYKYAAQHLDLGDELKIDRISFVHLNATNAKDIEDLRLSNKQMAEFYFKIWPQVIRKSKETHIPISVDPYFCSLLNIEPDVQIDKLLNHSENFKDEIDNFCVGLYGMKFYSQYICDASSKLATIDWNGDVYACPSVPRTADTIVGNIRKMSFSECWKTTKYEQFRNKVLAGNCPSIDKCSRNFAQTAKMNKGIKIEQFNDPALIIKIFLNQFRGTQKEDYRRFMLMVYYAYLNFPFYTEKFRYYLGQSDADLNKLPYVKKSDCQNEFSYMQPFANNTNEPYGIFKTSACGQDQFLYARPLTQRFNRMAASFLNTGGWKIWDRWLKLTSLNCIEAAEPVTTASSFEYKIDHDEGPIIIAPDENYLMLPLKKIKDLYKLIIGSGSTFIHANPTYLKLLLHRFKKEGLFLSDFFTIHSTYEILLPSTKERIKKYISCEIFDQYGCSEVGPISFTCRNGNHHIFTDSVYVELIPAIDINRPDIGRIVVTDLENKIMPFVKYFTGDFAYILKERCECDLRTPTIGKILGRQDEILEYKKNAFFPLEVDLVFQGLDDILMYQIIYEDGHFLVNVIREDKVSPATDKAIIDGFRALFKDKNFPVTIKNRDFILPKRRGKFRTVINARG